MNSVKSLALALCCMIFASCTSASDLTAPNNWILITAGKSFSFRAPPGTVPYSDGGIAEDSFVGMYRNSDFTLMFDYGLYSNTLSDFTQANGFATEQTEIDGRTALIVTGSAKGSWDCKGKISAVYLVVDKSLFSKGVNRLEMNGCTNSEAGIQMLHQVFHSLQFTDTPDWRANFHSEQN